MVQCIPNHLKFITTINHVLCLNSMLRGMCILCKKNVVICGVSLIILIKSYLQFFLKDLY